MMKRKKGQLACASLMPSRMKATEYFARIIFMNASALNTNLILLNSTSNRFPNGLGNDQWHCWGNISVIRIIAAL